MNGAANMMNRLTKLILTLAIAVILIPSIQTASAQVERHVVTIENGKVFIDGTEVPKEDLPSSLRIKNLTASMNFTGDALL